MLRFSSSPSHQPEAQSNAGLLLSKHLWLRALDLLFPPRCAGCGRVDTAWCSACQHEIDQIPFPPVQHLDADSRLRALAATGPHDSKLQHVIWSLKFENNRAMAVPLGQRMSTRLAQLDWTIDMLVPVPLHMKRLRERGYNQSTLLAEHIALMQTIPLQPQAIHREIETRTQVGLDAQQRQQNVAGAFIADPSIVTRKTILLIDDVYTTGATMTACAQAALDAGATAVYGLTASKA